MRAVGYRQLWAYLDGECDWAEARSRALAATRQLAKRQLTSLRSDAQALRLPLSSSNLEQTLLDHVKVEIGG